MEDNNKNLSLDESYCNNFHFSELSQSTMEAENTDSLFSTGCISIIDYPTIILDPDEPNVPNNFSHSQCQNTSSKLYLSQEVSKKQDQNEIKSELIKSELNEIISMNSLCSSEELTSTKHKRNIKTLKCGKCEYCPFISISNDNLTKHTKNSHPTVVDGSCKENEKKKLICPGCENVHYAKYSLEIHLKVDHKMIKDEIAPLLSNIVQRNQISYQETKADRCLEDDRREPSQDSEVHNISEDSICTLDDHDQTLDNNLTFIDLVGSSDRSLDQKSQKSNKISIKSVDVLREPSLNDHSEDSVLVVNENSASCPLDSEKIYYDLDFEFLNNANENIELPQPIIDKESKQAPQSAKIYIKNVDILKESLFVPPSNMSVGNILNVNDDLRLNSLNSGVHRKSIIPVSTSNDFNQFIPKDTYHIHAPTNHMNVCPNGIFIKNVDILKQQCLPGTPNLQEFPRRFINSLHLRTVDELNLMNTSEVQNLITPILDQNTLHTENVNLLSESPKNSDEIGLIDVGDIPDLNYNHTQNAYTETIQTNWANDNYNSFSTGLDMDSNLSSISNDQKNTHIELNTPQMPDISENDENMDFIYPKEFTDQSSENKTQDNTFVVEIIDDTDKQQNMSPAEEVTSKDYSETVNENRKNKRGRPCGAKQTGITEMRKLYGRILTESEFFKCDLNCGCRFRKAETLRIHKKCHVDSSQEKQCPECKNNNFSSWNTLHTHLWRSHQIDMELFSCKLCNFKTPILSRLVNTHVKIHSEEKNFKCEQCEKAFKNNRQLKNHKRTHRNMNVKVIHTCMQCGAGYTHLKSLKQHMCNGGYDCPTCGKQVSTKSTLKLHLLTHKKTDYRFKCEDCQHETNDHNAFRRHRMIHEQSAKYYCKFCDYKCIQSNLYQRHVLKKHPTAAHEIVLKCPDCTYSTINQTNFKVHLTKHVNSKSTIPLDNYTGTRSEDDSNSLHTNDKHILNAISQNKIKVKSDLTHADPKKFHSISPNSLRNENIEEVVIDELS